MNTKTKKLKLIYFKQTKTILITDCFILISLLSDCTVKVWDLSSGQEMATLTRHHSYVRKVTYCPTSQLVFTACQSLIKIWDLRDLRNPQFIKTLLYVITK